MKFTDFGVEKIENRSLKDTLYIRIRDLILNNEFAIGEKITKDDLAKRFGVSPTPVNDALNRLVGEHYLALESRKGYFVREYDRKEYRDLFAMRAAIEGMAAKLICEQNNEEHISELVHMFDAFNEDNVNDNEEAYIEADMNFHAKIIMYSENSLFLETAQSQGFLWRSYQKGLAKNPSTSLREHMAIIEAFKIKDGDRAQKAVLDHLMHSREKFRD